MMFKKKLSKTALQKENWSGMPFFNKYKILRVK